MTRPDGREDNEIRPLACEIGVLGRADGSAQFSMGNSSVLACVYGPVEARAARELPDRAVVEVVFKPITGVAGVPERALEGVLSRLVSSIVQLPLHPRCAFHVDVQVLVDDGSLLACAINAVAMALADAAVPLDNMVAAATVATPSDASHLLLDATAEEVSAHTRATITHAFRVAPQSPHALQQQQQQQKVDDADAPQGAVLSHGRGLFSDAQLVASEEVARLAAEKVASFMRIALQRKYAKNVAV